MAIYVYVTTSNALYSWIPGNETIAQAQANNQLADNATLTQEGLTAVDTLPNLDSTHVWNVAIASVSTTTAPTPAAPMPTFFFISRFTSAEWRTLVNAAPTDNNVQQFLDAMNATNVVDMTEPIIKSFGNYCITKGYLTSARANTIYTTPFVRTSLTS